MSSVSGLDKRLQEVLTRPDFLEMRGVAKWDYPDSVDRRQGSTGVSVRVLMDTCS